MAKPSPPIQWTTLFFSLYLYSLISHFCLNDIPKRTVNFSYHVFCFVKFYIIIFYTLCCFAVQQCFYSTVLFLSEWKSLTLLTSKIKNQFSKDRFIHSLEYKKARHIKMKWLIVIRMNVYDFFFFFFLPFFLPPSHWKPRAVKQSDTLWQI
jgi:hypothetical protein